MGYVEKTVVRYEISFKIVVFLCFPQAISFLLAGIRDAALFVIEWLKKSYCVRFFGSKVESREEK